MDEVRKKYDEEASKADLTEMVTRQVKATASQLKKMIDMLDEMHLPLSLSMDISFGGKDRNDVTIYYRVHNEGLVQWFLEEVLRREALLSSNSKEA